MKSIRFSTKNDLHIYLSDFYDEISYDGSPEFSRYIPSGVWFTLCEDEEVAGLINLTCMNNIMWQAHVMIYPSFRGNGSEEWAVLAAQYMKEEFAARKILAITPYEAAKKYALRAGFEYVTMLTQSIQKNGEILDMYVLERSLK